jgi:hypothetical protein
VAIKGVGTFGCFLRHLNVNKNKDPQDYQNKQSPTTINTKESPRWQDGERMTRIRDVPIAIAGRIDFQKLPAETTDDPLNSPNGRGNLVSSKVHEYKARAQAHLFQVLRPST